MYDADRPVMRTRGRKPADFIRKQLAIARIHEEWLKEKARVTGESESTWVRRAIQQLIDSGV